LVEYLNLSQSQVEVIQQLMLQEQQNIEPLMTEPRTTRAKLLAVSSLELPSDRSQRSYHPVEGDSERSEPEVLVLYLKRPRAKSWELRRCVRALQIQRLEGSRPGGLWDLYLDEPVLIVCEFPVAVKALGFP
jgi:hypothetical protein